MFHSNSTDTQRTLTNTNTYSTSALALTQSHCFVLSITSYPAPGFTTTAIHAVYHSRDNATHGLHEMMSDEDRDLPGWTVDAAYSRNSRGEEGYLSGYTLKDAQDVIAKAVRVEKADFSDGLGVVVRRL